MSAASDPSSPTPHRRRLRYSGKNPRRFEEKYKEQNPSRFPEEIAKILASGKTPAGTHRPIMVAEVLEALRPARGEVAIDCTLGYGGHAVEILQRLQPGGRLIGLDVDPIELPKTVDRLQSLGFGLECFAAHRSNFAGLPKVLATEGLDGADIIFADLGVSSMQIDAPDRGFSFKGAGPLDMRMNPLRGRSASALLQAINPDALARMLVDHSDEPHALPLAQFLAGKTFETTTALANQIRRLLAPVADDERELSVRRVFQALRIAVNDEFSALDSLLRLLPQALRPNGRVAILSFHSGEDRRVKKAFEAGVRDGLYAECAPGIIRPSAGERNANPRSTATKLRWARRAAQR